MVKSLHPIAEIPTSDALESDRRVRLTHIVELKAGSQSYEGQSQDVAGAVKRALREPLEFPPLTAAIIPGDRVAIVLDEAVPCVGRIALGAVEVLRSAGIDEESISVVTGDTETSQLCRQALSDDAGRAVKYVVHDAGDQHELCMVGMIKKEVPVRVNRAIFDADVVLPVGCARLDDSVVYDTLYPRFSDSEAIQRFGTPSTVVSEKSQDYRTRAMDEAGRLIGAPMVIEVVPGADETVSHVIAGEPHAVARRARELAREQWAAHSPRRVSLVIATVTGGPATQNWNNVGRALAAAERLVTDDGAVAICSNLEARPGESLGRLLGSPDLADIEHQLLRDHADDSWPAWQLARALQRGPVYFLSQLDSETVEDLGMAPVADIEELSRLASRQDSFIVLEGAQHAVATVVGEEDET